MARATVVTPIVTRSTGLLGTPCRFGHDRRAIAAVEFALILPVMLLAYIGLVDVSRGVIASRKLNVLSRTVSDLVSQQPTSQTTSITTLSTIMAAASSVMHPFDTTGLVITVSAVDIKANNGVCCTALVRWSYTNGATTALRSCSPALTQVPNGTTPTSKNIPLALVTTNVEANYGYLTGQTSYLVVADVTYTFRPIFLQAVAWFAPGMRKTTFMVPRSSSGPVTIATPPAQNGTICFS